MKFYYENCMGDTGHFREKDLIKAIYTAWNIEADLYLFTDGNWQIIFSPHDGNEFNTQLLEPYGYKMVDGEKEREIIDLKTENIIKYDWSEVRQLV